MLALAGIPATGGFIGKISLIEATVDGGWTWLGIFIVLGAAASLAYYLRVLAAMWMRPAETPAPVPALAGGSAELEPPDEPAVAETPRSRTHVELVVVAVLAALLTLAAGVYPDPLFDAVREAAESFDLL
jgi:NADH-quinone oxidoreductase subunit N